MHDLGIGANVGCGGGIAGERAQVGEAAYIGELAMTFEVFGDGDGIRRLLIGRQSPDGIEDGAVIGAIEILRLDHVRDVEPGGGIKQQTAQHSLFRL